MTLDKLFHHPLYYYNIFYTLAIICCVIIFISEGYKRKFQPIPYALTVTSGLLAFIIGCHVITFSSDDWLNVFNNQSLGHQTGLSVLGGILLSVPIILILKKIYGFKADLLDAYAYILPIGMCVQRMGCFLAGCCYGVPTNSAWGVSYPNAFPVFHLHENAGLINSNATHALPVHPVQLYEAAGCIIAVVVIYFAPRFLKAKGNLFFLSGLCYYIIRFFSEFLREPVAHSFGSEIYFGINLAQWLVLILILVSTFIIIYQEQTLDNAKSTSLNDLSLMHLIHYVALLTVFIVTSKWLSTLENYLFQFFILTLGTKLFFQIYTRYVAVPKFAYGTITLSLLAIIMMSQTSSDSAEKKKVIETYNTVSFGYLFGNFEGRKQVGEVEGGCDPIPVYSKFDERFQAGNIALSQTWIKEGDIRFSAGLNTYISKIKEKTNLEVDRQFEQVAERETTFTGFNPYFMYDHRTAAITAGVHVGKLYRIKTQYGENDNGTEEPTLFGESAIYPHLAVRIGNRSGYFGTGRLYDHSVTALPAIPVQLGFGYGFRKEDGTNVEIGLSSFSALYVAPTFVVENNINIKPYLGFGGGVFHKFENSKGFIGSLSVSMNFNRRQKN